MGGGLAGIATAIHLARAGLRVACVEANPDSKNAVGESLDWSAPDLLRNLGLSPERLLEGKIATWKRHVILQVTDGRNRHYVPGEWLARSPWNVELKTLHVDRAALKSALREIALAAGVEMIEDSVVDINSEGEKITSLRTRGERHVAARWFVDASGIAASLLPRKFSLPFVEYGPQKVAMWNYFAVTNPAEGTTLYTHCPGKTYLSWIWEIPINPTTISVGYVAPGPAIKEHRQRGKTVEDIYREELSAIPRFAEITIGKSEALRVVSFHCRVHERLAGPNWVIVGESGTMVDPMTSNGVTAALRHAEDASRLILRAAGRDRLPRIGSSLYTQRAQSLAKFFNCGIEKVAYDWPIREAVGVLAAGDVYTVPAWTMNLVYSRMQPEGIVSTFVVSALLACFRAAASIGSWICRRFPRLVPSMAGSSS